MYRYLAPLLVCFSHFAFAQQIFREIPLPSKPAYLKTISTPDRLFISYAYYNGTGTKEMKMLWVDSIGSTHNIPNNDFLSRPFINVVMHNESDYFYFIASEGETYYLSALIINRETNGYQIPKTKILLNGYPLGCQQKNGMLKVFSFHKATNEFVESTVSKLEIIESKKYILPVNVLEDFIVIDEDMPMSTFTGRFHTKIFPQEEKTIITIDKTVSTRVFSLDHKTENVSQLDIDEKIDGNSGSFVYENILVRITNSRSKAIIRTYNIDLKTELSSYTVYPDTLFADKTIWNRTQDKITNQEPLNNFFYKRSNFDPSLFVTAADTINLRICWASYLLPTSNSGYNGYYHTNPNTGNIWADLIYVFIIEPAINVGVEAISESVADAQTKSNIDKERAGKMSDCSYFYINYDKKNAKFSSAIAEKTTAQSMDQFDLYEKEKSHLKIIGRVNYNHHEYGIYFKHKHNSLVLVKFK
jgi:hypothetical protein